MAFLAITQHNYLTLVVPLKLIWLSRASKDSEVHGYSYLLVLGPLGCLGSRGGGL